MMENQVLTDPSIIPVNIIMENILGKEYELYKYLINQINNIYLILGWYYHKERGSWIAKIVKSWETTNFPSWLFVLDIGLEINIIMAKKDIEEVCKLNINDNIKNIIKKAEPWEQSQFFIEVKIPITSKELINDVIQLLKYIYGIPAKETKIPDQMLEDAHKMTGIWKIEATGYSHSFVPTGEIKYTNKGNKIVELEINIKNFAAQWYGEDILVAKIDFLLNVLEYEKIIINTQIKNVRYKRLYEKAGFVKTDIKEKTIYYELTKETFKLGNNIRDDIFYILTRKNYKI